MNAGTGNDFEVNLVPDIAILHDAGYHVLAYDLRNFGLSGAANGGLTTSGRQVRVPGLDILPSLNAGDSWLTVRAAATPRRV